ncbi:ATP-dependent helicase [Clostridium sp. DJ247]|nr:ATP-dependent helicase [Clostridium sp. DJ247]
MQFREDQKPIMDYVGGTMAVPAVPGAGKTFIIANLAAKIIKEKRNEKGKILIVTYMNSAVNNFKNRICAVLDKKGIKSNNDYEVMTIHSLAMKILKDRPDILGVNEEFKILEDVRKTYYLGACIDEWRRIGGEKIFKSYLSSYGINKYEQKSVDWWNNFFVVIDNLISELKINNISPEMLIQRKDELGDSSIISHMYYVYNSYVKRLKVEGYIDYNDLLIFAYKALLIDKKLKEKYEKKYSFIFEDECQDSNVIQYNILSLISQKSGNLVRVGDMNQSIMGTFTSSDPSFFHDFCKKASNNYVMNMAGRSTKEIIEVANYLVSFTREKHVEKDCRNALAEQFINIIPENMEFANPKSNDYGIYGYCLSSWEKEKETTVKAVLRFINSHPNKTCAVLVPFNNQVSELARELRKLNIQYDELCTASEIRFETINTLGYILSFLADLDNIYKFKILIDNLLEENCEEKQILMEYILRFKVEDILYWGKLREDNLEFNISNKVSYKILKKFNKKLQLIKSIVDYIDEPVHKLILHIGDILELSIENKAIIQTIANYFRYDIRNNPNLTLSDISETLLDVKNSPFKYISDMVYDIKGYEALPGRITLATYHKSKGLEWDCVFLLCLTEYNFPASLKGKFRSEFYYFKSELKNPVAAGKREIMKLLGGHICYDLYEQAKIDAVNERIRLLYVGITRAKEYLVLMSHYEELKNIKDEPSLYYKILKEFIDKKRNSE